MTEYNVYNETRYNTDDLQRLMAAMWVGWPAVTGAQPLQITDATRIEVRYYNPGVRTREQFSKDHKGLGLFVKLAKVPYVKGAQTLGLIRPSAKNFAPVAPLERLAALSNGLVPAEMLFQVALRLEYIRSATALGYVRVPNVGTERRRALESFLFGRPGSPKLRFTSKEPSETEVAHSHRVSTLRRALGAAVHQYEATEWYINQGEGRLQKDKAELEGLIEVKAKLEAKKKELSAELEEVLRGES